MKLVVIVVAAVLVTTGCNGPYNLGPDALSSADGVGMEPMNRQNRMTELPPTGKYKNFVEYMVGEYRPPAHVTDAQTQCVWTRYYEALSPEDQVKLDRMATGLAPMKESDFEAIRARGKANVATVKRQCGVNG